MKVLILIPARYASTRFPGKPLATIGGKPMVVHVIEKALQISEHSYVATDDDRILHAVNDAGYSAVMTREAHRSGTDRCYEAYSKVVAESGLEFDVVVNVQGDEPFITPEQIVDLVNCFEDPDVQIATLAKRFEDAEAIFDPNKVKVVCGVTGRALYFSRNPIPYCRGVEQAEWLATTPYFKHVGMYAYRPEVLKQITELPQGVLERAESLEQLRWLENGYTIAVRETSHESIGIDTPADLAEAERMLLS
ncbi:MAG: 3-deoxy-manno-octulosonate cytidylyltransferase [Bacteroidales bacterium]|nr:3-deoxy-manno-octulosonate cytidylyltransferase [Bacteroidales bacterium]